MSHTPDTFNVRLLRLMSERGLNVSRMCKECDLHYHTLYALVAADRAPAIQTVITLADFFNVSLDYLCARSDVREIQK